MTHCVFPCVRWAFFALAFGVVATQGIAWAQESATASVPHDSGMIFIELLKGGGLPAALAALAWWARGVIGAGIPVVVSLSERDRRLIEALTARIEQTDPGVSR